MLNHYTYFWSKPTYRGIEVMNLLMDKLNKIASNIIRLKTSNDAAHRLQYSINKKP